MYCTKCNNHLEDVDVYYPFCGTKVTKSTTIKDINHEDDKKIKFINFLYGLLGLFIPMVGIVLLSLTPPERPKRVKILYTYTVLGVALMSIALLVAAGYIIYLHFFHGPNCYICPGY